MVMGQTPGKIYIAENGYRSVRKYVGQSVLCLRCSKWDIRPGGVNLLYFPGVVERYTITASVGPKSGLVRRGHLDAVTASKRPQV